MSNNVTILISSCDKYKATWKPLCYSLKKYWPDCSWPIKFITNTLDAPCGNTLKIGDNNNWSNMQYKALQQISTEIVLFMLDDFWLTDFVNTAVLKDLTNLILNKKADRIHLTNSHDEKKTIAINNIDKRLNGYTKTSRYRTSLQAGLWRTNTFQELLKDGETPWDFETKGSVRSQSTKFIFLNVKKHGYIPYITRPGACECGKWTNVAKEYIIKENIGPLHDL